MYWICSVSSSGLDENGTRDDNIETQYDVNHNDDDDDDEEEEEEGGGGGGGGKG